MELGGIDFGNAFAASGTGGLQGETYLHHMLFKLFLPGFDLSGSTFISKTATAEERMPTPKNKGEGKGNLVLDKKTLLPKELFPDCIRVNPITGEVVNSVGLPNPGIRDLFERGKWQIRKNPFFISTMTMQERKNDRLLEMFYLRDQFEKYLPSFSAPVGWQINKSCPNIGIDPMKLIGDLFVELETARSVGIPIGAKINVLTPIFAIKKVADFGLCDFIEIPNTLPFGERPDKVNWQKKFKGKYPMPEKYGKGGYSGHENFELALQWIREARNIGIDIPIICGAVSNKEDVRKAKKAGANAIAFARITMTPFHAWKVKGIINEANRVFGG